MALFGRRKQTPAPPQDEGIAAFWDWWSRDGAGRWAQVAGQQMPDQEMTEELREKVDAMGDGLAWEMGAGAESVHRLVVTADGNPALRATARRWLLAAPETDPIWSYADSRQAVSDIQQVGMQIGDHAMDGRDVTVGVRRMGSRIDVTVYHPDFTKLAQHEQSLAMFVLLDQTLGERQTETWIGELTPSEIPPLDGFGLSGLRSVVRDLAAEHVTAEGEPVWALLKGQSPTGPVIASAQVPLAAAGWPLLDSYVRVEASYSDAMPDGLPGESALTSLRELQEAVGEVVGEDGRVVGHETTRGVQAIHLYVDGRSDAEAQVKAAAKRWGGSARVRQEWDPGWSAVQHLRG